MRVRKQGEGVKVEQGQARMKAGREGGREKGREGVLEGRDFYRIFCMRLVRSSSLSYISPSLPYLI